ncbi:MAG TPA: alpha/beta hydrolase [Rhodobacteraceae bacterium]|jgi:acetyl esterase/lipase|nr:alpha/beta hydrolase [Paracoccaceae bacterium]
MSFRQKLLNFACRQIGRRQLLRTTEPEKGRRSFARLARYMFRTPPYSLYLPTKLKAQNLTVPALWISSGQVSRRRLVFYIHGGGFIVGSPWTHKRMLASLSRLTGIRVCAPQYRLSPEHQYPDALNDVRAAYQVLLDRGFAPDQIILGGDSAGGNLVFSLLADLCAQGLAPRAVFAFSPWTDLSLTGKSLEENANLDVLLPAERIEELRDMYLGNADPKDVNVSPLFAKYPDCPPVFLQASATEILRDDTLRLAENLNSQGAKVSCEIWQDLPHVWQVFDGWLPESRKAMKSAARFISHSFTL